MTTPLISTPVEDRIIPNYQDKITFDPNPNYPSEQQFHISGWMVRRLTTSDPEHPNGFQIVTDGGSLYYVGENTVFSTRMESTIPDIHNALAYEAYQRRLLRTQLFETGRRLTAAERKVQEINSEWEAKVVKACEEADERGYCSEFENIANAAGFDIPEMEEFDVEVEVTIRITVSKEARSLEKAKEMVDRDDVSSQISGEDSIEDWSVI